MRIGRSGFGCHSATTWPELSSASV
jgi:hypothetical protein